ncbi:hypothetical protein B484DRAFT_410601 [Ochromonadaceae sp. CCMP2298]|nr:hypothetical protein B484DRAFT_410601 [Ochromonadaceae sp. CCMP2298]
MRALVEQDAGYRGGAAMKRLSSATSQGSVSVFAALQFSLHLPHTSSSCEIVSESTMRKQMVIQGFQAAFQAVFQAALQAAFQAANTLSRSV